MLQSFYLTCIWRPYNVSSKQAVGTFAVMIGNVSIKANYALQEVMVA
jgi:hypothetical protein